MQKQDKIILIGYSGHAFVVAEAVLESGGQLVGYCDTEEKSLNPFSLPYWGKESDEKTIQRLENQKVFVSIGNNFIRQKIYSNLRDNGITEFVNVIHPSTVLSPSASIGFAVLISPNATINALSEIGAGAICNTGSIIEHECQIGDFAHIAPGAVLAGNVTVGNRTFIGANSVIKQGVTIGNDVTIGAGSVILKNVPDGVTVVGNPGRIIQKKRI